jgi:dCMP deaminase
MERPSWSDYFKQLASLTSSRSSCKRLHVGCVLVTNNRVISQGYNGYLPGCSHTQKIRDGHELGTIHAEQNAISDCAKRGVSCDGATAYITHYPCVNCMKILCAAGIKSIFYIADYNNDELVEYFSREANVSIIKLK